MTRLENENRFGVHVKALIINEKNKVLLLQKEVINPHNGAKKHSWEIPEENLTFNENVYNSAWRIANEQTGLDVTVNNPSNVWTFKQGAHLQVVGITFYCGWNQSEYLDEQKKLKKELKEDYEPRHPIDLSRGYIDFKWISTKEIIDGHYPIWLKDEVKKWDNIKKTAR